MVSTGIQDSRSVPFRTRQLDIHALEVDVHPGLEPCTFCIKRQYVIHLAIEFKYSLTCAMGMSFNSI